LFLLKSLEHGEVGGVSKRLEELESHLEFAESNDVEEGHKDLSILGGDDVRLLLEFDGLLLKHSTESALGLFHDEDVVGDLELGLHISHKNIVLIGRQIEVEEQLNWLGTTFVVSAEEAMVVCPSWGINNIGKVDVVIEWGNLVGGDLEVANNHGLESFHAGLRNTDVILNGDLVLVACESDLSKALNNLSLSRWREDLFGKIEGLLNSTKDFEVAGKSWLRILLKDERATLEVSLTASIEVAHETVEDDHVEVVGQDTHVVLCHSYWDVDDLLLSLLVETEPAALGLGNDENVRLELDWVGHGENKGVEFVIFSSLGHDAHQVSVTFLISRENRSVHSPDTNFRESSTLEEQGNLTLNLGRHREFSKDVLSVLIEVLLSESSKRFNSGNLRVVWDSYWSNLLDFVRNLLVTKLLLELIIRLADVLVKNVILGIHKFKRRGKVTMAVNSQRLSSQTILKLGKLSLELIVSIT